MKNLKQFIEEKDDESLNNDRPATVSDLIDLAKAIKGSMKEKKLTVDTNIKNIIGCKNHTRIKELSKSKSICPCKICDCENRIRKRIIKK